MKDLIEELQYLMQEYRFKPKHKLSQNFLISKPVIEEMAKLAELEPSDIVLEIGCGAGFLTKELLKHCSVAGFEVDVILQELLEKEIPSKHFSLRKESFLKTKKPPAFTKIVCCPPYHLSTDLLHWLFGKKFELGVLLLQKDFVERVLAEPGFREYCATAALLQYFYSPSCEKIVFARQFHPSPRADSAILKIVSEKRFGSAKNDSGFAVFVCELFRYKNKNLSKALSHAKKFLQAQLNLNEKNLEQFLQTTALAGKKVYLLEVHELVAAFNKLF